MSLTYYLLVDGIDGGSQLKGMWAGLRSAATILQCLHSSQCVAAVPARGATELSPLTVDLALGSGLTELLAKAASGQHLTGVKIEGVTAGEQLGDGV